jgi:DNA-binding phage protein
MKLPKTSSVTETILADIERRCADINTPVSTVLEDAGVDWSTWWRWHQGKSSPTLGTLSRVTSALDQREKAALKAA